MGSTHLDSSATDRLTSLIANNANSLYPAEEVRQPAMFVPPQLLAVEERTEATLASLREGLTTDTHPTGHPAPDLDRVELLDREGDEDHVKGGGIGCVDCNPLAMRPKADESEENDSTSGRHTSEAIPPIRTCGGPKVGALDQYLDPAHGRSGGILANNPAQGPLSRRGEGNAEKDHCGNNSQTAPV